MAILYIQGIPKHFYIGYKQKKNKLLLEYRAEIDSLYEPCQTDHKKMTI